MSTTQQNASSKASADWRAALENPTSLREWQESHAAAAAAGAPPASPTVGSAFRSQTHRTHATSPSLSSSFPPNNNRNHNHHRLLFAEPAAAAQQQQQHIPFSPARQHTAGTRAYQEQAAEKSLAPFYARLNNLQLANQAPRYVRNMQGDLEPADIHGFPFRSPSHPPPPHTIIIDQHVSERATQTSLERERSMQQHGFSPLGEHVQGITSPISHKTFFESSDHSLEELEQHRTQMLWEYRGREAAYHTLIQNLTLAEAFPHGELSREVTIRKTRELLSLLQQQRDDNLRMLQAKIMVAGGAGPQVRAVHEVPLSAAAEAAKHKPVPPKEKPPPPGPTARGERPQSLPCDTQAVHQMFARKDEATVISTLFDINLTVKLFHSLKPGRWLNSEVIGFFMELTKQQFPNADPHPKVYFFNSFFYQRLSELGYSSVQRWTRSVDLFSFDWVVVPVNASQSHWYLARINLKDKCTEIFDSLGGGTGSKLCHEHLLSYIQQEHLAKKKSKLDTSDWTRRATNPPQQMNGYDCGVYMCMFMYYTLAGLPLDFKQDDMPYFRNWIGSEILRKIESDKKK